MTRFLLQSLAIPAIQVVFDLILRTLFTARGGSKWDTGIYLTGLFACWMLSLAFTALTHAAFRGGRWPGRITAGVLAVVHTTLLSTNFFLFRFFGEYLFPGAVTFLTDPYYMMDYVRTFGGPIPVLILLVVWAVFYVCLSPWCTQANALRPWVALVVLGVTLPFSGLALNKVEKMSEYRMPPDMVAAESLAKHFLRVRDKVWPLRPSRRIPVVAGTRRGLTKPRTVLVIVNESMGTRGLGAWNVRRDVDSAAPVGAAQAEGMPRLAARLKADSGSFVVFQKAYTNSVATQVSMASLFAGVSPEESQRVLHCTPMLWDLAKAAGYRTAYFSSQRLRWASLSDFLLGQPIDSLVAREQTNHPPVNDMGIDDFHLVETMEAWLRNHPDEPLFVVWNTNALHVPYQAESEFVDLSGVPGGRFEKAQYLLDTAIARVFAALEKAGRFEDALIVNSSDHGEDPDPAHNLPRINSYYEEYIRIPLWVKLPRSLRGRPEEIALRRRIHVPVANIDIVPSLAALWGAKADARGGEGTKAFPAECEVATAHGGTAGRIPWSGENLFSPRISHDRTIAVLSTGDTRRWDGEGFGLVRGPWRVVLWPKSGRHLYNVDRDPAQTKDLWATAPDSVMTPFRRRIEANKWLKRIHDHHEAAEQSSP